MAGRIHEDAPQVESLPFADLSDVAESGLETDIDVESSRFTPPTWVRSAPKRRPFQVQWPPPTPETAPGRYYDELVVAISVDESVSRRVATWAQRACARVSETLRCHLGDVDAALCGSLVSTTHVATTPWDVDVFVRAHGGKSEWDADSTAALEDITRWLSASIDAKITRGSESVLIESPGGLVVDVGIGWRTERAPSGFVRQSHPTRQSSTLESFDPSLHLAKLAARNALLGRDSVFIKLLRIAKHLNGRWIHQYGEAPLTSFEIEVLALQVCTQPFDLAEGLPQFLRQAARSTRSPVRAPPAPSRQLASGLPDSAAVLLENAADRLEHALFATDPATSAGMLAEVLGRGHEVSSSS